MYKEIFGENHIEIARAYLTISEIYITENKFSQAIYWIEQALKIQIEFYGEIDLTVKGTYFMQFETSLANKEPAKCIKALSKRLRIQEKLKDKEVYATYEVIGLLYWQLKETENSRSYIRKAYQMKRIELGIDDEETLKTKNSDIIRARLKDLLENNQEKKLC